MNKNEPPPDTCDSNFRRISFSTEDQRHTGGVLGKSGQSKATFFSMASLINECIEVHSVSLKGKRAESHPQNTDLQRASSPFPLVTSDITPSGSGGGGGEGNTITISVTMTFKCLTSNLFFAVKIKQQAISFTMSHYAPVVQ